MKKTIQKFYSIFDDGKQFPQLQANELIAKRKIKEENKSFEIFSENKKV